MENNTNQPNENQVNQQFNQQFGGGNGNQPIPNATASLVLGILSIVTCWLFGIPGVIMGIIGLIMSKKGKAAYEANPSMYSTSSMNNLKAGKVCSIIGLAISSLYLIYYIVVVAIIGAAGGAMLFR